MGLVDSLNSKKDLNLPKNYVSNFESHSYPYLERDGSKGPKVSDMFNMPSVPSNLPPKGGYKVSNLGSKPDLSNMLSKNLIESPSSKKGFGIPTPKGSSSKTRAMSKDGDLLTSMTKRLT